MLHKVFRAFEFPKCSNETDRFLSVLFFFSWFKSSYFSCFCFWMLLRIKRLIEVISFCQFMSNLCVSFQQAYKEQVYGSKYVWIIVGWYNDDWWTKPDVKCEGKQLIEAAANMIETLPLPLSTSREPTISNRVGILGLHRHHISSPRCRF